ncbi:hypothetical protein [Paraburkholderia oxyphila]|uniref:hypothetical protein n=1 Tax=Paraburkholderia oxyphila TaxID=614212 RepID=UPI000486FA1B|nr:hypothetical protein [Paraburkholderia oxyphila]
MKAAQEMCALVLVVSSAFGTIPAFGQSTVEPVSTAEKPIFRLGDSWIFGPTPPTPATPEQMSHQRVIEMTPQQTRISKAGGRFEIDLDSTSNMTRDHDVVFNPSRDLLHFPMKVGDSWSGNYTYSSGDTHWVSHRASVDATEVVHVVAGDFFAFRLTDSGTVQRMHNGMLIRDYTFEATCWYAPSVKRVIKWTSKGYAGAQPQYDSQWELHSFSLAPDAPVAASAAAQQTTGAQ